MTYAVTFLSCSTDLFTLISKSVFRRVIIDRGSSKTPAAQSALSYTCTKSLIIWLFQYKHCGIYLFRDDLGQCWVLVTDLEKTSHDSVIRVDFKARWFGGQFFHFG